MMMKGKIREDPVVCLKHLEDRVFYIRLRNATCSVIFCILYGRGVNCGGQFKSLSVRQIHSSQNDEEESSAL